MHQSTELIKGNCLEVMDRLYAEKGEFVDLVFCDPPPNLSCRYLTHSTETVIWAAKTLKSKHTFNYDDMRAQNGGKGIEMEKEYLDLSKRRFKAAKCAVDSRLAM